MLFINLAGSKYNEETCGSVSDRIALRDQLQCNNFQWFLTNIYPELLAPGNGDSAFG